MPDTTAPITRHDLFAAAALGALIGKFDGFAATAVGMKATCDLARMLADEMIAGIDAAPAAEPPPAHLDPAPVTNVRPLFDLGTIRKVPLMPGKIS